MVALGEIALLLVETLAPVIGPGVLGGIDGARGERLQGLLKGSLTAVAPRASNWLCRTSEFWMRNTSPLASPGSRKGLARRQLLEAVGQ